jgi:hypothetical protein
MAKARGTAAKQAERKSKATTKSGTRAVKDLSARDAAKVKGGAGRRIIPCI